MKEKELFEKRGTIAKVLMKHKDELFTLIENNNYPRLRVRVQELLDDSSLRDNPKVIEAKRTFYNIKNPNLYYSTLITYMTGEKVSN